MMRAGWYFAGEIGADTVAHLISHYGVQACDYRAAPRGDARPWVVAIHVGRVTLCEGCKAHAAKPCNCGPDRVCPKCIDWRVARAAPRLPGEPGTGVRRKGAP